MIKAEERTWQVNFKIYSTFLWFYYNHGDFFMPIKSPTWEEARIRADFMLTMRLRSYPDLKIEILGVQ